MARASPGVRVGKAGDKAASSTDLSHHCTSASPQRSKMEMILFAETVALMYVLPTKDIFNNHMGITYGGLLWDDLMANKGSHPLRKVQFFLTLFKRPLTPPPFHLNIMQNLQ